MYKLFPIGKMISDNVGTKIILDKRYLKGLKYVELFSHILVFYADKKEEKISLQESLIEISSVDEKTGILMLNQKSKQVLKNIVFDIKPYFPCEDRVKESSGEFITQNHYFNNKMHYKLAENENEYSIESIGSIRKVNGENFIEVIDTNIFKKVKGYSHIKIMWWFHRFDNIKYRRCVECDPPYEDAPKTGVFASRSPVRPNPIAFTTAKIIRCDDVNGRIYINNTECFDSTPCIDICPYIKEVDCVNKYKVPQWLEHWPQWLDDRMPSFVSGDINLNNSNMDTIIESWRYADKYEVEENIWKQEDNFLKRDCIEVQGARQNNLKGIDITIPYNQITVVVGVSGSGKSSLVFDIIYAECRRRIMDTLSENEKGIKKPNIDSMIGAIPAIAISQKGIGKNSRSTVGTYSGIYEYLRIIFATVGTRHCPECKKPIVPLTEEEIISFLEKFESVEILNLNNVKVICESLTQTVKCALVESSGALLAKIDGQEPIILQTTQMCYHCNRLLFELTPATFNYSDLESMCPICNGYGEKSEVDVGCIIENPHMSILDGASAWWGKLKNFVNNSNANWMKGEIVGLANEMGIDLNIPWRELPLEFREKAIYGSGEDMVTFEYTNNKNGRKGSICRPVEGAYNYIKRLYTEKGNVGLASKYIKKMKCDCCNGERLQAEGRMVTIGSKRFPEIAKMTISELSDWCKSLPNILGKTYFEMVKTSVLKLYSIVCQAEELGISYLELDRSISTTSGGEQQRLKLLSQLNNSISGMLYVLDEPSAGLHPKDYKNLIDIIHRLRDSGNTILMVEHNDDLIKIADNIIEIGPGAGDCGGYLVGEGNLETMLNNKSTQVSKYMKSDAKIDIYRGHNISESKWVRIYGANYNNLKNIDVLLPINAITCLCGVSGSGKSSLLQGVIQQEISRILIGNDKMEFCKSIQGGNYFDKVILVDQTPIGRTPRSVPATYMGIMDKIRSMFSGTDMAKEQGIGVSAFSFNNKDGQCESCHGDGQITPPFTDDIWVTCPACKGERYNKNVLKIKYKNRSISDILNMSVSQAILFFDNTEEITSVLKILIDVGLGYLKLGQNSATLSGGEASRLKLAKELISKKTGKTLYLLDEPTSGLHFSDIENLIKLFQKIIDGGDTIVMIEHNKHVLNNCDWMIELGPKAGKMGGEVLRMGI